MIVFPNAKINLGLRILRKRNDGYHDLETIFYPAGWSDILEILPSEKSAGTESIRMTASGLPLPGTIRDNLVYRAAGILSSRYSLPVLRIHLHKLIPAGGGLGGGSSDAAFTLMAINKQFSLNLTRQELHSLALQLGSDCPFFLENKPALATGRGERFRPLDLYLQKNYITIIYPGFSVDTGSVFHHIRPSEEDMPLEQAVVLPPVTWKQNIINRFEEYLEKMYPVIHELITYLYDNGAWFVSVSGSGSSVYGFFKSSPPSFNFPEDYLVWTGKL